MSSKEERINILASREVLQSFSPSEMETSVEWDLCCAYTHHDSLKQQSVEVGNALEMANILDVQRENVECIMEEEQAYRLQVATLSHMQL